MIGGRLGSLLVERGLVSVADLRQCYLLQVIGGGGGLDTLLMERELVAEGRLIQLVSEASGFPAMPEDLLEQANPRTAKLVPWGLAGQLHLAPVHADAEHLFLLASAATNHVAVEELAYELQRKAVVVVGTELRVKQAASIVYGRRLSPRFRRLLSAHGQRPSLARSSAFTALAHGPYLAHLTPTERAIVAAQQFDRD